jgi:hypothetical protein
VKEPTIFCWADREIIDGWQAGHVDSNHSITPDYWWLNIWRRGIVDPMQFKFNSEEGMKEFAATLPASPR